MHRLPILATVIHKQFLAGGYGTSQSDPSIFSDGFKLRIVPMPRCIECGIFTRFSRCIVNFCPHKSFARCVNVVVSTRAVGIGGDVEVVRAIPLVQNGIGKPFSGVRNDHALRQVSGCKHAVAVHAGAYPKP